MAGLALALVLASPAPSWAQQAAAPAAKAAPKLTQSYHDRVEELQDQVNEGKLAEIRARIVPTTERKVFDVGDVNDSQTWWQYEDDTTFVHIENGTGRTITGLVLDFWVDSCSQKAKPPIPCMFCSESPCARTPRQWWWYRRASCCTPRTR